MALPPLTPEQRAAALEKAAVARRERAAVKNRLKYAQGSLKRGHRRRQGQRGRRQDEGLGAAGVDARRRPGPRPPDHGGGRHLREPPRPRPRARTRSPLCSPASTRREPPAPSARTAPAARRPRRAHRRRQGHRRRLRPRQLPRGLAVGLATTRTPRPGEVDGHPLPLRRRRRVRADGAQAGELLESAVVHGRDQLRHPAGPVEEALRDRPDGPARDRPAGRAPGPRDHARGLFVFLAPPSWDELVRRLVGRGTEDEEEREPRLETAKVELAAEEEFDVTIVNDDVRRAAEELVSLMRSH